MCARHLLGIGMVVIMAVLLAVPPVEALPRADNATVGCNSGWEVSLAHWGRKTPATVAVSSQAGPRLNPNGLLATEELSTYERGEGIDHDSCPVRERRLAAGPNIDLNGLRIEERLAAGPNIDLNGLRTVDRLAAGPNIDLNGLAFREDTSG